MRVKKKILSVLAVLLSTLSYTACKNNPLNTSEKVLIRVENNSIYSMHDLKAVFPDEAISYGDLNAGSKSRYQEVKKAYRFAYLETIIDRRKKVVLQPIDFTGEQFLQKGKYTYVITVDEEILVSGGANARYALRLGLKKD